MCTVYGVILCKWGIMCMECVYSVWCNTVYMGFVENRIGNGEWGVIYYKINEFYWWSFKCFWLITRFYIYKFYTKITKNREIHKKKTSFSSLNGAFPCETAHRLIDWLIDWILVFNATFSNISAISWRPVLVVEEAGVPGDNHRPCASNW